jgi:hypothetical protein
MKTANTPLIKIADAYLFNQRPYYYLDLINYFTSAGTFDVAPDATIAVQVQDVGHGLLQANDRILLLGCAVEESPYSYSEAAPVAQIPIGSRMVTNNISITSAVIVNSNPQRKRIVFFNNSINDVYLDTVSSISPYSYLVKLVPNAYYEAPIPASTGNYYAVTTDGNTSIDIREFV